MSILVNRDTTVIVQGITGRIGSFHSESMLKYGTRIVAGVTPGRGGETIHDIPVFDTVKEAVAATAATASVIMVPPQFAADSIMEAADGNIKLAVSITDGIPSQDMIRVKRYMRRYRAEDSMRLLGPNCAGIITPGETLLGVMPGDIYNKGNVGIITRSGTLGYEAAVQLQSLNIGISTSVGIGGDPINGSSFVDILKLFEADPDTDLIIMIGEIGGPQETDAAEYIRTTISKPVVAYVAGLNAPRGRAMGHASTILSAIMESADEKIEILREVGATIAPGPSEIASAVAAVLAKTESETKQKER